jgi:hypothetical protein
MRMRAIWTAERLARVGLLPANALTMCPCCEMEGSPENITHILLECAKWSVQRAEHLDALIANIHATRLPETADNTERQLLSAYALLGGSSWNGDPLDTIPLVRKWWIGVTPPTAEGVAAVPVLALGPLAPGVPLPAPPGDIAAGHEYGAAAAHTAAVPACVQVARFLTKVMPSRMIILSREIDIFKHG